MKVFFRNIFSGFAYGIGILIATAIALSISALLLLRMDTGVILPSDGGSIYWGSQIDPAEIEISPITTSSGWASSLVISTEIKNNSDRIYQNIHLQAFILVDDILVNSCSDNYYYALEPGGTAPMNISCRSTSADASEIAKIELKITEAEYAIHP